MRQFIDVTGKTEDEAIQNALRQLGLDRDDVSVEILERAKSGFLGLGSCPAKVRVSYGPEEEEEVLAPAPAPKEKPQEERPKPPKAEKPPRQERKPAETPAPACRCRATRCPSGGARPAISCWDTAPSRAFMRCFQSIKMSGAWLIRAQRRAHI